MLVKKDVPLPQNANDTHMDTKISIDPEVILSTYKAVGDSDIFTQVWVAAAYYIKYHGRLPRKFNEEEHPIAYGYFINRIKPLLDGKPEVDSTVDDTTKSELLRLIKTTTLFDADEKKVLNDLLDMWWGRGKYARTELIYTQSMCQTRTGVGSEKFIELRKWLKAEGVLTWENRPYGDYLTSYHMVNEARLYEVLKDYAD